MQVPGTEGGGVTSRHSSFARGGGWRENEIGCDYVQAAGHIRGKVESRKQKLDAV